MDWGSDMTSIILHIIAAALWLMAVFFAWSGYALYKRSELDSLERYEAQHIAALSPIMAVTAFVLQVLA
jgi:hypothetical protein